MQDTIDNIMGLDIQVSPYIEHMFVFLDPAIPVSSIIVTWSDKSERFSKYTELNEEIKNRLSTDEIAKISIICDYDYIVNFEIDFQNIRTNPVLQAYNFDFVTEVLTTNAMMVEVKRLSELNQAIFPEQIARHIIAKITNTMMEEVDNDEVSKLMNCDPYNMRD